MRGIRDQPLSSASASAVAGRIAWTFAPSIYASGKRPTRSPPCSAAIFATSIPSGTSMNVVLSIDEVGERRLGRAAKPTGPVSSRPLPHRACGFPAHTAFPRTVDHPHSALPRRWQATQALMPEPRLRDATGGRLPGGRGAAATRARSGSGSASAPCRSVGCGKGCCLRQTRSLIPGCPASKRAARETTHKQ